MAGQLNELQVADKAELAQYKQEQLRPGFNVACNYRAHTTQVRALCCNPDRDSVLSFDELGMRLWAPSPAPLQIPATLKNISYPRNTAGFVNAVLYAAEPKLFFVACMDSKLRIYKHDMRIKSCLPWNEKIVFQMHFVAKHDQLVISGAGGVKVYCTIPDEDAFAKSPKDPDEIVLHLAGRTNKWAYGQCQSLRERMTLRVPGANIVSANDAAGSTKLQMSNEWIRSITVHEKAGLVFVHVARSVYGFRLSDGYRLLNWENIHAQRITQVLYLPEKNRVVIASDEPRVAVWALTPTQSLKHVSDFGSFSSILTALQQIPGSSVLITATVDGNVVAWNFDTLEALFKMKVDKGVRALSVMDGERVVIHNGHGIRVIILRHFFTPFGVYNSALTRVHLAVPGMVQANFEDSSVRFVDVKTRDTTFYIPPQLTTHSVRHMHLDTAASCLHVVLCNGHVHTWHLSPSRPPHLKNVWVHLERERLSCITTLLGSLLAPDKASALGLCDPDSNAAADALLASTRDGDIIVIDKDLGEVKLRFCAHKLCLISHMELDADYRRLLTVADAVVKVWDLSAGFRVLQGMALSGPVTCVTAIDGFYVAGTTAGSLHFLDMSDGTEKPLFTVDRHAGAVTGLTASAHLKHVVSSSTDGTLKVWTSDRRLVRTILLSKPIGCVCFANDKGDLLAGLGQQLVVIRAAQYHWIWQSEKDSRGGCRVAKHDIFERVRGTGFAPLIWQLAAESALASCVSAQPRPWWIERSDAGEDSESHSDSGSEATDIGEMTIEELVLQRKEQTRLQSMDKGSKIRAVKEAPGHLLMPLDSSSPVCLELEPPRLRQLSEAEQQQAVLDAMQSMGIEQRTSDADSSSDEEEQPASCILASVKHLASLSAGRSSRTSTPAEEAGVQNLLQPALRRAMRIVAHPDALYNGVLPDELKAPTVKRGKKTRRKKKRKPKKNAAEAGLPGLQKKALNDLDIKFAVKEYTWGDLMVNNALKDLIPKQRVKSRHLPQEALGLQQHLESRS